jgi:hypothetical protein
MKTIIRSLLAFTLLTTLGCMAIVHDAVVSSQPTYQAIEASWPQLEPGLGRVVIYFPRLPAAGFNPIGPVGGWMDLEVKIDGKLTTMITDQSFVFVDLAPGSHSISHLGHFWVNYSMSFEVKAGELAYIEIQRTQFESKEPKVADPKEAKNKLAKIHHQFSNSRPFNQQSRYSRTAAQEGKPDSGSPTTSTSSTQAPPKPDLPVQGSEQAFRELSEDLRKYERLQQSTAAEDERTVAWADLTKKYPQWTKDVPVGDTDAVRFRALQDAKATQERAAAIPKAGTEAKLKRITLRNTPDQNFYESNLYNTIKDHNFFSKSQNSSGDFLNDFVDNGDGTVTDRVTGLMWQREGTSSEVSLGAGLEYVQELNANRFGGYANWRLPTIEELCSLLEPGQNQRGQHIDMVFSGSIFACWSSDKKPLYGTTYAYVAFFGWGDVGVSRSEGVGFMQHFVRAVRTAN